MNGPSVGGVVRVKDARRSSHYATRVHTKSTLVGVVVINRALLLHRSALCREHLLCVIQSCSKKR